MIRFAEAELVKSEPYVGLYNQWGSKLSTRVL
jgi:hypothetical protein